MFVRLSNVRNSCSYQRLAQILRNEKNLNTIVGKTMLGAGMLQQTKSTFRLSVIATFAVLMPISQVKQTYAGGPPPGVPSGVMPWDWNKYDHYRYVGEPGDVREPAENEVTPSPEVSSMQVTPLPHRHTYEDPQAAFIVAYVPKEALIWVEGRLMKEPGERRMYITPSLAPGYTYFYTVKIRWLEEGKWVTQMHQIAVRAGDTHTISIVHIKSKELAKDIDKAMSRLSAEDAKAARAQKTCVVQTGVLLGSMGPPVKVVVDGKTAFVCCTSCVEQAQKDPQKTLAILKKLQTRPTVPNKK